MRREMDQAKKLVQKLTSGALVLALFSSSAQAAFEPRSVGARAAGLAEAYSVVADDWSSLYYNPAGLQHVRRPEVGSYMSRLFMGLDDKSEVSNSFFGYVHPLPKKLGVAGVSYINLSLSGLYAENTIGLSYARSVGNRWNVGGTLKSMRKSFGTNQYTDNAINVDTGASLGAKDPVLAKGQSKSVMALDLGGQYRLAKNYALGFAFRNVNQPNTAIAGGDDKAPAVYAVGLSRWTRVSSLSLEAANWKFGDSQDYRLSLGGERWFRNGFGMRGGLGVGSRQYRSVSLGGSYRMDGFQFDYALGVPMAGLEKTAGNHNVSLTFRFGKPAPDPIEMQLGVEREARLRAEAEMARLRQQLMEITADRPSAPVETRVVDDAASDAFAQAAREIKRLKETPSAAAEPAAPVVASAARPSAAAAPGLPVAAPKAPAKPRIAPDLLAEYGNSLKFYTQQAKSGASVTERTATLQRIIDKYTGKGIDLSSIQAEMKKLKGQDSKIMDDYKLAYSYYQRIVQQGTSPEEQSLLLERIIKKYKPLGVDTASLEKELENLKKKR
jgi:hypothetical protein